MQCNSSNPAEESYLEELKASLGYHGDWCSAINQPATLGLNSQGAAKL